MGVTEVSFRATTETADFLHENAALHHHEGICLPRPSLAKRRTLRTPQTLAGKMLTLAVFRI